MLADRTVVLVTHDALDALLLADRVVVLEGGAIVEQGPTADVLSRPRSAFAARIAGLNMLVGTWQDDSVRTDAGIDVRRPGVRPGAGRRRAGGRGVPPQRGRRCSGSRRAAARATPSPPWSPSWSRSGDRIRVRAGDLSADVTAQAAAELDLAPGAG